MRKRFLLVENPVAGVRSHGLVERCCAALAVRGASVERVVTKNAAHTQEAAESGAKANSFDALIVAGGDGTVRNAASGLIGEALPFGIIPSGTGNVLAGELKLPRTPNRLADYLCSGKAHTVTGGTVNGKLFLMVAGIGLDAEIVSRLHPDLAHRIGRAAYAPAILRAVAGAPKPRLTVCLGNQSIAAEWVIVVKSTRFAGPFLLTRKAGILKPGLQLVSIARRSRFGDAMCLVVLPFGMLQHMPGVRVDDCVEAVIEADRPTPVEIDGDLIGTTPVKIGLAPAPINLILPD